MQSKEIVKFLKTKDFVLLKDIGQGGTGNTKLLRDETIGEDFICKKYSPFYPEHKNLYYNNFVDEIKILYKINHPNIVRVFNYYLYPDQLTGFIIMEYIDGVNIEKWISNNPDTINDIFIQTIEGFKYLEERNILHRDIRPSNILISNTGAVKIIDFGFGKNIDSFEDYGKSISLNWEYSLPNEFKESKYDFKTEIYFIGKLFEYLISINNLSSSFQYNQLLSEMILNYENRPISFFEIYRKILSNDSELITFSQNEKKIYSNLADAFMEACTKMQNSTKYINDFDIVKKNLEGLYKDCVLEEFIQNNSSFLSCFINPPYSYTSRVFIPVSVIYEFLKWINTLNDNFKKIVLNNLWQRFDTIYRDEDDLPF